MKKIILIFLGITLLLGEGQPNVTSKTIPLSLEKYHPIIFDNISPTSYSYKDGILFIKVECSSSALLLPFKKVRKVSEVSFEWKSFGKLHVDNEENESSKKGDDCRLRVAFLVFGENPSIPFFAPSWIKKIQKLLPLSSNQMLSLFVDAKHPAGTSWSSPYTESIQNIAVESVSLKNGWKKVHFQWQAPKHIVGIWLMSDGDNTHSVFETQLRHLKLKCF